jgi:hypothetical protein
MADKSGWSFSNNHFGDMGSGGLGKITGWRPDMQRSSKGNTTMVPTYNQPHLSPMEKMRTPGYNPMTGQVPAGYGSSGSPYAQPIVPQPAPASAPPSMSNVPANPTATGQATQQEIAGMTLEQWRNVQRMLGMAPSV